MAAGRRSVRPAGADDVDALVRLINAAFAVERFFKVGDRTSRDAVEALLLSGTMFVTEDADGIVIGSVYVELRGDRVYIGMVSVDPARQGQGIGGDLMAAAEDIARDHGCVAADISVVNLRTELPPFYRRLGYAEVGTAPFTSDEETTRSCHFILMSKTL
jgi:predicted N-acetyltransferase YhbS